MATWTQVQAVTDQVDLHHADTDGISEIYLLKEASGLAQVHIYDVVADTLTAISTLDSGGGGVISGPVYFAGGLYCATSGDIYKYTGSGTTWDSVESLPGGDVIPSLAKSTNHLVVLLKDINDATPVEVRYSVDGATWANGTVSSTPARPAGSYNGFFFNWYNPNNPTLGLYGFDEDQLGASQPSSPSRYRLMRWEEIGFTLTTEFSYTETSGGVPDGDDWIFDYQFPDMLHWYLNSTDNEYDTTLVDGTFTAPANPDVSPVRSTGFNTISTGWSSPSTNLLFHQMIGAGQWDSGEVVDTDANAGTIQFVVRMDNGDVYILTQINDSSSFIYARSEPIDDGEDEDNCTTPARLYYGIEVPELASELPFCRVNPGGLAISAQTILAVVGTGGPAAQSVVFQYPAYNNAEWNDISGIVPTGTAVTSIKFV